MAHKHLRSIVIKEVAQPKTSGEKSFVAKHVIVKHPDRNGNDDRVFKAAKTKVIKRSPRHGYDAGQDEKVYEDQQNVEEGMFTSLKKKWTASARKDKLLKKINKQMDDRQEMHGIQPYSKTGKGVFGHPNIKKLYHDGRYTQLNNRSMGLQYMDQNIKLPARDYLTGKGKKKSVKEDVQLDESVAREHYIRHHNNALQHAKEIVKHLQTHSKLIDSCPSCHSGHIQDMKMLADNLAGSNLQIGQHVESEQRMAADRKKWSKPQPLVREQEELDRSSFHKKYGRPKHIVRRQLKGI